MLVVLFVGTPFLETSISSNGMLIKDIYLNNLISCKSSEEWITVNGRPSNMFACKDGHHLFLRG